MPQDDNTGPKDAAIPPEGEPLSAELAPGEQDEAPISLVEEAEASGRTTNILGGASVESARKTEYQRSLNVTGRGATRCRLFYSKIAVPSLMAMEQQINNWLDSEQIEIKHVAQVVGTMQGKVKEDNVIVYVWY